MRAEVAERLLREGMTLFQAGGEYAIMSKRVSSAAARRWKREEKLVLWAQIGQIKYWRWR
jgi:hypothetical protein